MGVALGLLVLARDVCMFTCGWAAGLFHVVKERRCFGAVGKSLYHYEAIIHLLRVGVKLAGG